MSNLFHGLAVLDFTSNIAGPTATAMLADFGAEVIKIERPGIGDDNRGYAPFIEGKSIAAMWYNRGKESVVIDAKHPKGLEILRELANKSDIIVESFRPGIMAKMGLSYDAVMETKPRVIMCSVSAFGQNGPYYKKAGYDLIAQALSGAMDVNGFPDREPVKIGICIADFGAAFHAFGAISAALYHRERTGKGQYIDIALLDGLLVANEYAESAWNGFNVERFGNIHNMLAPFGPFHGNDGTIIIGAVGQNMWAKLCVLLGREELIDDPAYMGAGKRVAMLGQITPMIENCLKTFPSGDDAGTVLDDNGIPCARVSKLKDLLNNPQIQARNMIVDMEAPELAKGSFKGRGSHLKFSGVTAEYKPAPVLGQHTKEVLTRVLGYSAEQLAPVRKKGCSGRSCVKIICGHDTQTVNTVIQNQDRSDEVCRARLYRRSSALPHREIPRSLSSFTPDELSAVLIKGLLAKPGLKPTDIDQVHSLYRHCEARNCSRRSLPSGAAESGAAGTVISSTIERACTSSTFAMKIGLTPSGWAKHPLSSLVM
jgi:crotonobetainyl-CoA:carnitine CoA-transferase CaiB-like acyl-CoA transferase